MSKIKIKPEISPCPMPVVLVGSIVEEKPNFQTVGLATCASRTPRIWSIALSKDHHTTKGIREQQTFSINIPSSSMVEKVDYCGIVSGKETDKSHLFKVFYGELRTAPMISECPVTAECKVIQIIDLPSTLLILGEMVAAYSESRYLTENRLDINKVDPITLSVPDNRYWGGVGRYLGDAWSIGNKVKRS